MARDDEERDHGRLMDRVYRRQRHFYDLTRRYYLLGRDRLIENLAPPPGATALEVGCGTGRNLVCAARRHPQAEFFGVDISHEMLATARRAAARAGMGDRIRLASGDATRFHPYAVFGFSRFDRIFMSYTLSMIPDWQAALAQAACNLAPGGSLHIVDFGQQERLPRWFRALLQGWLARFHVTPRRDLDAALRVLAEKLNADLEFRSLYRGYAWYAVLRLPVA
ncbi:class I SAM-dependent methyltransferase [uncultured Parvibaculum sp.]|uniref:class I SAM-dependent methyltransferase n=1 Tax=uncultured Parvibaculum sp. TaxID=291828 RepID=UPI0030DD4F26|tara:strand:+ start:51684 stop:52352 length:669 start_codon:yes stop_codon:yes gene_type:complete